MLVKFKMKNYIILYIIIMLSLLLDPAIRIYFFLTSIPQIIICSFRILTNILMCVAFKPDNINSALIASFYFIMVILDAYHMFIITNNYFWLLLLIHEFTLIYLILIWNKKCQIIIDKVRERFCCYQILNG